MSADFAIRAEKGRCSVLLKSEKGTVLIELVVSCLVLIAFFYVCMGTFFLIRDKMYLERVVRDGAREAAITGDLVKGKEKAEDRATQFFGSNSSAVTVSMDQEERNGAEVVTCTASYMHPLFGGRSIGEVKLNARAVFCWKDT